MLKETELQDAIGNKMPNIVKPQNEALIIQQHTLPRHTLHRAAWNVEAQTGQQTT